MDLQEQESAQLDAKTTFIFILLLCILPASLVVPALIVPEIQMFIQTEMEYIDFLVPQMPFSVYSEIILFILQSHLLLSLRYRCSYRQKWNTLTFQYRRCLLLYILKYYLPPCNIYTHYQQIWQSQLLKSPIFRCAYRQKWNISTLWYCRWLLRYINYSLDKHKVIIRCFLHLQWV